ncbi:hypothetical protein SBO77_00240 [Enterococcus lactis]|nr:hypothetical protein [Enterococcus lactis]
MVNFKKDKNGKYHFTASLGFDKRTGKRVQKNVEGLKQLKKKKAYTELVSNYGKEAETSQSTMLFEEFFYKLFLPYYQGKVEERTYKNRWFCCKVLNLLSNKVE